MIGRLRFFSAHYNMAGNISSILIPKWFDLLEHNTTSIALCECACTNTKELLSETIAFF